jgi:protein gp37
MAVARMDELSSIGVCEGSGRMPDSLRAYMDAVDSHGWTGRVACLPERLGEPLRWRRPRRVFVDSMSDLFQPGVPFEFIAAVFGVMAACPQHTFQVLTKRPERALEFFGDWLPSERPGEPECACVLRARRNGCDIGWPPIENGKVRRGRWPLPNVHLGVSVEDQPTADERIPLLLQCPAAVRWVSYEPALGPVMFTSRWPHSCHGAVGPVDGQEGYDINGCPMCRRCGMKLGGDPSFGLDWIVVGGESGPNARPFDVAWARSTVRQCREAGVPVFVKQLGANPIVPMGEPLFAWPVGWPPTTRSLSMGAPFSLGMRPVFRDRAGADPEEWPADLRVREWPEMQR